MKLINFIFNLVDLSEVVEQLKEEPIIESDYYGDREYYFFYKSGISIIFDKKLNEVIQVEFFFVEFDGFYRCKLLDGRIKNKEDVFFKYGVPDSYGGGFTSPILGWINYWVKYDIGGFFIRFEMDLNLNVISSQYLLG